jgi:hypothetical protein
VKNSPYSGRLPGVPMTETLRRRTFSPLKGSVNPSVRRVSAERDVRSVRVVELRARVKAVLARQETQIFGRPPATRRHAAGDATLGAAPHALLSWFPEGDNLRRGRPGEEIAAPRRMRQIALSHFRRIDDVAPWRC